MYKIINMSNLTTLGVGGKARVFDATCESQILGEWDKTAFVLGNGSNILASDFGVKERVLRNRLTRYEYFGEYLRAQSGCSLSFLAKDSANKGFSGLEWAYLLPATVGGATVMNAGAFGKSVSDCIKEVEVARGGRIVRMSFDECGFSYRNSNFSKDEFIMSVTFKLEKSCKEDCLTEIEKVKILRDAQPKGKSAGCIYKAIGKGSGYYIDKAGLKGEREGDIFVSPIHAGFFINAGNGTAKQTLTLMDRVEKRVMQEFGIRLEREIILVGEF